MGQRIPTNHMDRLDFCMAPVWEPQLSLIVRLDGALDERRLGRALELLVAEQPVLDCGFVPRAIAPYWLKPEPAALAAERLLSVGSGRDAELERFLAEPLDLLSGPQLQALLLREDGRDTLALKASHLAVDAGGLKELSYRLAALYRDPEQQPANSQPQPRNPRGLGQVYRQFTPWGIPAIIRRFLRDLAGNSRPRRCLVYPSGMTRDPRPCFEFLRIGPERGRLLHERARRLDATLNDLLVAALLRAYVRQLDWRRDAALRMVGTVDLRRYLPGGRGIAPCNLSSHYFINLGCEIGDELDETVAIVKAQIDALKSDRIGLGWLLGNYLVWRPLPFGLQRRLMPRAFLSVARSGNNPPSLTNMGVIDERLLDFNGPNAMQAELAPPSCGPPFVFCGVSGFRDSLTFSMGHHESALPGRKVRELFGLLDQELNITDRPG